MKRIGYLLLLFITFALATAPPAQAQDGVPVSDDEVNVVAKELYCPVCPNTPLDVCETQACKDWRDEIRTQLSAGWSEEEVVDYFVERYGERVLAEPQRGGFTSLVWILPVVAVLMGMVFVVQALRDWRFGRHRNLILADHAETSDDPAVTRTPNVTPEARARIERELQELL